MKNKRSLAGFLFWGLFFLVLWLLVLAAQVRGGTISGTASWYGPGNGVAMPFCTWTVRHSQGCGWAQITSSQTGLTVDAPIIDYCQCYVGTSDERIIDLQWGVVAALGLDRNQGLYPVTVDLIDAPVLTDTAMGERQETDIVVTIAFVFALFMLGISLVFGVVVITMFVYMRSAINERMPYFFGLHRPVQVPDTCSRCGRGLISFTWGESVKYIELACAGPIQPLFRHRILPRWLLEFWHHYQFSVRS